MEEKESKNKEKFDPSGFLELDFNFWPQKSGKLNWLKLSIIILISGLTFMLLENLA